MFKTIGLVVALVIVAILLYAAMKPDDFRVQREIVMNAPPDKILPLINDFHNWSSWSPYEKLDPAMKRTIAGAPEGKGAIYEWEGNNKVGQGRMEILESAPALSKIKLDFLKPFEAHNTAEFTLVPQGDGTKVTWAMYGPAPFMSKLMGVFVNMDRMIGADFETGLANLKALAERK